MSLKVSFAKSGSNSHLTLSLAWKITQVSYLCSLFSRKLMQDATFRKVDLKVLFYSIDLVYSLTLEPSLPKF